MFVHIVLRYTGERHFACMVCQKSLSDALNLNSQMLVHTRVGQHVCTYCLSYNGEHPFTCTVCQTSLSDASNLKSQMLLHTRDCQHVYP